MKLILDVERLTHTGRRTLSLQEELDQGKVWNPASQRYRQKVNIEETYRHGILYVSALNIYLDKAKFPTRCLKLEVEKKSGIVWYTTCSLYSYKKTADQEKQIKIVYDPDNNIYLTPVHSRVDTPTPDRDNSDSETDDANDRVLNTEKP